jgi:microcystin-dependent protein
MPTGAVAAFNLATYPTAWADMTSPRGRMVIGVGQGSGLTNRTLNETGGSEKHTLYVSKMSSHRYILNQGGSGALTCYIPVMSYSSSQREYASVVNNVPPNIFQPF